MTSNFYEGTGRRRLSAAKYTNRIPLCGKIKIFID
jgi:hypothetical protein